jgi:hypothetical protein
MEDRYTAGVNLRGENNLVRIYNIDLDGFDVDMILSIGFVESFRLDFLIALVLLDLIVCRISIFCFFGLIW